MSITGIYRDGSQLNKLPSQGACVEIAIQPIQILQYIKWQIPNTESQATECYKNILKRNSNKKVVSSVEYSIRPPVESQFFWTTTPPPKQLSRTFAIPLLFIFITLYTVTRCLTLSEGLVNGVASLSKDWNILTHSCIVIGDMHIMKPGIMMVAMGTDPIRFFPGPSRPSRHMTSTISQIYELWECFWLPWQLLSR